MSKKRCKLKSSASQTWKRNNNKRHTPLREARGVEARHRASITPRWFSGKRLNRRPLESSTASAASSPAQWPCARFVASRRARTCFCASFLLSDLSAKSRTTSIAKIFASKHRRLLHSKKPQKHSLWDCLSRPTCARCTPSVSPFSRVTCRWLVALEVLINELSFINERDHHKRIHCRITMSTLLRDYAF